MSACLLAFDFSLGSVNQTCASYSLILFSTSVVPYIVGVVLVLLVAAVIVLIVMHLRKQSKDNLGAEDSEERNQIDLLLRDVRRKLQNAQQGATSLHSLPLFYVLGETNSGKTTTVIESGLDPELLVGSVRSGDQLVSTELVNIWFTRSAAFLECGTAVQGNIKLLSRLISGTRPATVRSAFGNGASPRAAIVCVSAEQLLRGDSARSARVAAEQLREMSRILGTPVPVYTVVTKLDRIPHFDEFVRNLSDAEVRQILGSRVIIPKNSPGTYADQTTNALDALFDFVSHQLAGFRLEVLQRETQPRNAGGSYEYPREFAKLRKNLTAWLVELCRPTHLNVNPYLRGFYFTGVRARAVEKAPGFSARPEMTIKADAGATQYLNLAALRASQHSSPAATMTAESRVPQWTFLARLLPEAILSDKAALMPSRQTAPARLFRRALYATAVACFALWAVFLFISWRNNAALETRIGEAARALQSGASRSTPTLGQLQAFEQLRQSIVQLEGYSQNGVPLTRRFGLYQGDRIESRARSVYFEAFRPMFLDPTQAAWLTKFRSLPQEPAASSDSNAYSAAYDPLKAYLITTSQAQHSQSLFLTPVFLRDWPRSRSFDLTELTLAQKQVDFYGTELLRQPPYSIQPEEVAVSHTRQYLSKFLAETRVYQEIIADADKANTAIDFGKLYPDAGKVVVDRFIVPGAFTRSGFAFTQDSIAHPERHAQGEAWVLGPEGQQIGSSTELSSHLRSQYTQDFLKHWYSFVQSATVVGCSSLSDATMRLGVLAGPNSPLLELFYTISHNTAVADQTISSPFQPAQALVDANAADRLVGAGNQNYIRALGALGTQLDIWTKNPASGNDPASFAPVLQATGDAGNAAQQTAQSFKVLGVDAEFRIDRKLEELLQAPLQCVSRLAPKPGAAANGGSQKICDGLRPLLSRFPFAPNASVPASLAQVDAVFVPDSGLMWTVDHAVLQPYLLPQGAKYIANPAAPQPVNPQFVDYFSRLAHVSALLYPSGQKSSGFNFTLHFLPGNGISNATWVVDGQRIATGASAQTFTWTGLSANSASLEFDGQDGPSFQGTWALFQLARTGTRITRVSEGYRIDYPIDTATTIAGHTVNATASKTASFIVSGPGAELLAGNGFAGLGCVGDVVR